jgi:CO/xanthine dehydrogenase FAD-binding subunit
MTTHATVAASADVQKAIPALAELAGNIGDRQVRNRGTIGGSLANNDPAACYPAAVLGLGATVHTNTRTIAADDFFKGMYETALADGEVITAVSFPVPRRPAGRSSSSRRRASRSSGSSSARARRACAWRSPAPAPACSAPRTWKPSWPPTGRPPR